ncbi:MAG: 3-phosphoshikimate 1-carboxyvinyltransferase [Candidatus Omnitrophota bacterium]|nr:MAG: 3-phosphoshikimate 1-carboxyvinyltransferase [Candidatus Omnitrophota bacterium]
MAATREIILNKINKLQGEFTAPADKSISQRALMFSAITKGKTVIRNFLDCVDCRDAISAFRSMGIEIKLIKDKQNLRLEVQGRGLYGLIKPEHEIYLGNSGTTMRLLAGLLSGQRFSSVLKGDSSLSHRPMRRILDPLRMMGAQIQGCLNSVHEYPPLKINGRCLKPIKYEMPIASAQVKSAVLLAGLYAQGITSVYEKLKTRDHTEKMLCLFQAQINQQSLEITINGGKELVSPGDLFVPGDISSCAFFIIAASIIPESNLIIRNMGINSSRSHLLILLKRMGANISIIKKTETFEPVVDLQVKSAVLKGITVTDKEVAYCIDELPIICVAACFARGVTKILNAEELRVKETDRIYSVYTNLKKMGADIENQGNDLIIRGCNKLKGGHLQSFGDHRTAMSMAVAALSAEGKTVISNAECIDKSFPEFMEILKNLSK